MSTLAAAVPIFVLLLLIGVLRKPAWIAGLSGLGAGLVVAIGVYGMPVNLAVSSTLMGAAFGLLPIAWIVYWAVVLYRLTLETGNFEIIKDSIGSLTADRRLQAMLIAFAFGAFVEGAAGFGTPVAVAAAMLTGLGFSPFFAAGICLLANTAPVAFGSIGIPVVTLAGTTGLSEMELSQWVGRLCAPISVMIPAYLILVMGGFKALKGV
ncbi:MAG TPA: L-lactate permease, partial [Gammaproteobacteria bacterium]|nr:L-lactate permease [Gammaproteobacteria bacterium]